MPRNPSNRFYIYYNLLHKVKLAFAFYLSSLKSSKLLGFESLCLLGLFVDDTHLPVCYRFTTGKIRTLWLLGPCPVGWGSSGMLVVELGSALLGLRTTRCGSHAYVLSLRWL